MEVINIFLSKASRSEIFVDIGQNDMNFPANKFSQIFQNVEIELVDSQPSILYLDTIHNKGKTSLL